MDKREKIESILKAVERKLEEFFDVEQGIDSSIEYENMLIEVGQFLDKQIIQGKIRVSNRFHKYFTHLKMLNAKSNKFSLFS